MQSGDVNRFATGQGSNASSRAGSETSPAASPNAGSTIAPTFSQHNAPRDSSTLMQTADSNDEQPFVYFTTGDDDDADLGEDMESTGLTKKDLHTLNEQKRRDVIKQGYAQLGDLVPSCRSTGAKLSRAAVLQRTIDYVVHLQSQADKHQDQLEQLEREVQALRIMRDNYAQIAQTSRDSEDSGADSQVPDDVKFQVFQGIADQLFPSFNSSISVTNFDTLSSCIINWLEEYCKPQLLRGIVVGSLARANALSAVGPSELTNRDRMAAQMQ
eukprot:Em0007g1445a